MNVMKIIGSWFSGRDDPKNEGRYVLTDVTLAELLSGENTDAMKVATYYSCIKILSETMAKMPIKIIKDGQSGKTKLNGHRLYEKLNYKPNTLYNAITLRQQAEFHRLDKGNAYIWIDASTFNLWLLNPDYVTPILSGLNDQLVYIYNDGSKILSLLSDEVIHLKSHIVDKNGIKGIPMKSYFNMMLGGQIEADKFQFNLVKSGMSGQKLVMEFGTGAEEIDDKVLENSIDRIEKFAKYHSGKILPLPPLVNLKALDLKLTDSQFLELRKLSSDQISSAFGIPPMMLNDLVKSSYSSQEMQMLDFLVRTLQPIIQQYEVEMYNKALYSKEKKDGLYISYNTKSLLRTTAKEQAEYLKLLVDGAMLSPNEARAKLEEPKFEDPMADELIYGNGAAVPLKLLGSQYVQKGGE